MISYLKGQIIAKQDQSLILNTGNIGYLVHTPLNILTDNEEKDEIELFIHTHVREDNISLYGFQSLNELDFFKLLLSVSGIGPKLALEVTSTPPGIIKNAIFAEDIKTLTRINGLGKKTAQRMVLELKNKVEPELHGKGDLGQRIDQDAVEALINLGYQKYQIIKTLSEMDKKIIDTEEIIKYFLKNA